MKTPTVSVIVTCYNYGKYLKKCLESVLYQSFTDFEIIIINDGSIDNTDAVVSGFLNSEKIKYIKQNNSGQAIATNNGIIHSSGQLIAFLDADDIWENNKLEQQVSLFSKESIGVVYSRMKYIDQDDMPINYELKGEYFKPRAGYILDYLVFENFIPYSSTVVRRECFNKYGMFNKDYINGLDWDMWLRISRDYEFIYVDKPLLLYRVGHSGKLTSNIERSVACSDLIFKRFLENNPNALSKKIINKALAYSYCGRGNHLLKTNLMRSIKYYFSAIRINPLEVGAYIGLMKVFLSIIGIGYRFK